jgi:phytoene dehydrogenase-like protein
MQFGEEIMSRADVTVVGGGLAGLTAAAVVARAGRSVLVLEQASDLGGRAVTQVRDGVHWNLGAHAIYCRGHAFRLLRELGVPFTGRYPSPGRALVVRADGSYRLPAGFGTLLGSMMLSAREKWRLVRFLASLGKLDVRKVDGMSVRHWLEQTADTGNLALFLAALFRVSTYAADLDRLSAGAGLDQLRLALTGNVWYLDGGWQTLVDGLRDQAAGWGAEIQTRAKAEAVEPRPEGVRVRLSTGDVVTSRAVVIAVDPERACEVLDLGPDDAIARWTAARVPVQAACLDVALDRLPRPAHRFALGLDRPFYASVHSAAARLAPAGVAVVHVMKYLGRDRALPAAAIEIELDGFLDQIQPGWRSHTLARRLLPVMTVAHGLPSATEHGLAGRPPVTLDERPAVFLAGDWVGHEGMLADASVASAERAARAALAWLERTAAVERSVHRAHC